MKMITRNFNHERLAIAVGVTRAARTALSTAFKYTMQREAFGKRLIDQPVVRNRLARCGTDLEALSAWIDQSIYQMNDKDARQMLGGSMALLKAKAGMVLDDCARCAVLLFGGKGYTRTRQGEVVEKIYREVPAARVPGGSEDVMLDLAIRQMLKFLEQKGNRASRAEKL
ncbi:acyl-CoA dehydrogenase family protein [Diaporthe sp. PMI_573]|nr:acyl-CoA dehydrogenase family protein [Diaporthaceae sp. PMI_573]